MAIARLEADVGLITGMVWVSNQSSEVITVMITGGNGKTYTITPKGLEVWAKNHWTRKAEETAKVKFASGKAIEFKVGKDSFVNIYEDAVAMWECNAFEPSKLLEAVE